jgi:hypothetical protein
MKIFLRLTAALALLTLGACAQFYSETPILTGADSVPAYGTKIGGVDLRNTPEDKPIRFRSAWKDGVYIHTRTERRQDWSVKSYQIAETLAASNATPGSFISQRATEKEGSGGVIYYYDLIKPIGDKFVTYNMTCSDLSQEERARFNMVPPLPEAPAVEAPAQSAPAAGPGLAEPAPPAKEPNDCLVRTRADLEAAFAAIASRKEPVGELKVVRKRRGLFGG